MATIIMIPKPLKDPTSPDSYRPISLLNTLSKILERVVLTRILKFTNANRIINIYQSGFRSHHQTKDQILRLVHAVKAGFNRNQKTGAVLIDIEKAFDKVWHKGLLYKMKHYNFPNYLCLWVEDYLSGRQFQVRVGKELSSNRPIEAGVPQGSVLGPVLFNIFFNDVTCVCAGITEMGLFADDLSAWYSSVNFQMIELKLQGFLDNLQLWLSLWRMKLSVKKTIYTVFNPAGQDYANKISLNYNQEPISYEKNPRLLGVILDPALSFIKHAETLRERAEPRANMLRNLRGKGWGMNVPLLLATYKALILSLIDYAPQVTVVMCGTAKKIVETIQSKYVRNITRWPSDKTNKAMLKTYEIEEILPRAQRLMDEYLLKAHMFNPLIHQTIESYKIAPQLDEGLYCKLSKPHPTPFGAFKKLPPAQFPSVNLLT